jgi:uncharacterized protein (TIGR03067 family)
VFRLTTPLLIIVLATASRAAPGLKDRPGADPDLVGDWDLKSLTQGSEPVWLGAIATQTEFTADGQRVSRNRNGVIVATARYAADRGKTPREFDLRHPADGPVTSRGVYSIDGDTLTVFYVTDPKADRPAKLEAPAGSKVFQAVYVRRR